MNKLLFYATLLCMGFPVLAQQSEATTPWRVGVWLGGGHEWSDDRLQTWGRSNFDFFSGYRTWSVGAFLEKELSKSPWEWVVQTQLARAAPPRTIWTRTYSWDQTIGLQYQFVGTQLRSGVGLQHRWRLIRLLEPFLEREDYQNRPGEHDWAIPLWLDWRYSFDESLALGLRLKVDYGFGYLARSSQGGSNHRRLRRHVAYLSINATYQIGKH